MLYRAILSLPVMFFLLHTAMYLMLNCLVCKLYGVILSLPVIFFTTYCYVPDVKLSCMSVLNFH